MSLDFPINNTLKTKVGRSKKKNNYRLLIYRGYK